jgi:hypothetical protein
LLSARNAPHWQRQTQPESEKMEIFKTNRTPKQAGLVILVSINAGFKTKLEKKKKDILEL